MFGVCVCVCMDVGVAESGGGQLRRRAHVGAPTAQQGCRVLLTKERARPRARRRGLQLAVTEFRVLVLPPSGAPAKPGHPPPQIPLQRILRVTAENPVPASGKAGTIKLHGKDGRSLVYSGPCSHPG